MRCFNLSKLGNSQREVLIFFFRILCSTFPIVGDWTPALNALGVPPASDAYSGQGWGGFVATSAINPANWTRSYSRSAYIDPLPPRPNLSILPNATVTNIVFASNSMTNLTAVAVQYANAPGAPVLSVNVTKEVLLAGGAIGTPQVLMLSGVGPQDVLQAAGVPVQMALPGVGQHVQDHIVCCTFLVNQKFTF